MIGNTTNPTLQKIEQAINAKVDPQLQNAFQRIVAAGLKIMYSPQTRQLLQNQMRQHGEPTEIAGEGVAKLIAIAYKESRGTMPMKAAIPAAQVLLCEALDFMAKAGMIEITNDTIAESTKSMIAYLLQIFGFTQQKIQQFMQKGMQYQPPSPGAPNDVKAAQPAAGGILSSAMGAQQ